MRLDSEEKFKTPNRPRGGVRCIAQKKKKKQRDVTRVAIFGGEIRASLHARTRNNKRLSVGISHFQDRSVFCSPEPSERS